MKRNRSVIFIALIVLLGTLVAGCNWFNSRSETKLPPKKVIRPDAGLLSYFPDVVGTKWSYIGMGEFSQNMTLLSITQNPDRSQTTYHIIGKVGDPSGGAAKKNFNFRLDYVFTKDSVYEKVIQADTPFPHRFKDFRMLALPLQKGTKWTQTTMINSIPMVIQAEILSVTTDGRLKKKMITVRYRMPLKGMPNGVYEEVRQFVGGIGVYSFEKTFGPKPQDRFSYHLSKLVIPRGGTQTF